jgi:hypothetical protein
MYVETIVLPRSEWERGQERLRYTTDPPETLVVSIAWDSGDGQVTGINVWETAGADRGLLHGAGPTVRGDGRRAH